MAELHSISQLTVNQTPYWYQQISCIPLLSLTKLVALCMCTLLFSSAGQSWYYWAQQLYHNPNRSGQDASDCLATDCCRKVSSGTFHSKNETVGTTREWFERRAEPYRDQCTEYVGCTSSVSELTCCNGLMLSGIHSTLKCAKGSVCKLAHEYKVSAATEIFAFHVLVLLMK